jgi:hypothetical protein
VATTQTAASWIAISQNGKLAFTTNPGSGTISSLPIGPGAVLTLENAVAGVTGPGSSPQDAAFSFGGRFLYVRNDAGTIAAFRMEAEGRLMHLDDFGPLPGAQTGSWLGSHGPVPPGGHRGRKKYLDLGRLFV